MVEPISTALAGIALVKKSVDFVKQQIQTCNDIGDIIGHIDKAMTGEQQVIKARDSKNVDHFAVENVAQEVIDAKLAREQMNELRNLVNLRFGPGTWEFILQERKKRIDAKKQAIREAKAAKLNNYCLPEIENNHVLEIKNGRHPVIERYLPLGEEYVPNDIYLDCNSQQIMMITGPNMSGKSALIRQTALIVIMAQMGCFVPAQNAKIGLVDKVFTRVGASDNISSGESTFMVEMNETASILNNISPRSLILLDEIGRGTSTYDGISIAWAIAEYLHENKKAKCKTLFATHYHELNEMTHKFGRIKNFNVSVKEVGKKILFIRKLVEGGSEHSFGIHVAKMAGMPSQVVKRSEQILNDLEAMHSSVGGKKNKEEIKTSLNDSMQLSFFQLNDPVLEQIHEELKNVDINGLTPVDALLKLNEIKKLLGN